MNDRELLEMAAKAAGIDGYVFNDHRGMFFCTPAKPNVPRSEPKFYNWLNDDGDALRLAVKLQIIFGKYDSYANAAAIGGDADVTVWNHQEKDPYIATRLAIVKVAAEIGKAMP